MTNAQLWAFGRHVITALATVIGTLAALNVLDADQAAKATEAVTNIGTSLSTLVVAITTLIGIFSAMKASFTASPLAQIFAVRKMAGGNSLQSTDAQVAIVNAAASLPTTEKIVNPVLSELPSTSNNVTKG